MKVTTESVHASVPCISHFVAIDPQILHAGIFAERCDTQPVAAGQKRLSTRCIAEPARRIVTATACRDRGRARRGESQYADTDQDRFASQ